MTQQIKAKLAQPLLVTKTLIVINALVFVADLAKGAGVGSMFGGGGGTVTDFERQFGYLQGSAASSEIWRMVTSGFIHFGIMHIGFNMLLLYRLGDQLERGIGRSRFLMLYTVSLLGGSLGEAIWTHNRAVSGGASGAIFGLAAAAAIALMQRGIPFYSTGWAPLLIINLVFTFAIPGIGIGAHMGGLIVGGLIGYIMLHPHLGHTKPWIGYIAAAAAIVACVAGARAYEQTKYGNCEPLTYQGHPLIVCDSDRLG